MKDKEKALGGQPRAGNKDRDGRKRNSSSTAYCNPYTNNCQVTGDVGRLVDQALNFIDRHESAARHFERLARKHRAEIERHRQIKRQLEQLIPSGQPWSGGTAA